MGNKLRSRGGAAGWAVVALALAFAVLVGVYIALAHRDKDRERERAAEFVAGMVAADIDGYTPRVETEVVRDFGEKVLIAARYRIEIEGEETVSGSYLLNISDLSQQVYDVSDEYEYDHDFAPAVHSFARRWGIT